MTKIIVEVGANNGNDTFGFLEQNDTYVYAFEPVKHLYDLIESRYADRENLEVFNMAVSDFDGKSTFGISDPTKGAMDYGCSSLFQFTENIEELWPDRGDFKFIDKTEVPVIRMDTFIRQKGIDRIDYMHCDAQGGDLKVLKSFGDKLSVLKAGVVEAANSVNLYDVDNSASSIVSFLEQNGFIILNPGDLHSGSQEIDIKFERG